MKRILVFILSMLACIAMLHAQNDLHVYPVFEGKIVPQKRMIETKVVGESLEKYKLRLFHSVKMNVNQEEMTKIWDCVMNDINAQPTEAKDLEYGKEKNLVSYCIVRLKPKTNKQQRYLCYQCYEASTGGYNLTLVYMEGTASLSELKKTFRKK